MAFQTIQWDSTTITKPGCYGLVPLDLYHDGKICDGPSVSSSGLRRCFDKSPAHFYCEWGGNPNRIEPPDKPHFVLGRATHHLMLGEPFFAKLFAAQPLEYPDSKTGELKPWHGSSNYCKAWKAEQDNAGRQILKGEDIENIKGMARALSSHPFIKNGALNGQIERSIFWKDKATGLWLKARPDSIPLDSGDFVDLKTTTSVQWIDLQKTIFDCGYYQQGALVRRAAREVLKIENPTFTLIFVEKKPPYCVRVVTLKDNDLALGDQANRHALDTIARCIKSAHWPGPGGERDDAAYIEMPEWAQKRIEDKIKFAEAA
jgi:hypothetical protein